ncbi:MAG: sugar transferase [Patescibacteria group bacterium]
MRRLDLTFTALLLPLDFLALFAAAMSAYALRYSQAFIEIRPIFTQIPFPQYLATATGFILVWMALFWIGGLYSIRGRSAWRELGRIILASTAGIMVVIAVVFFQRELATSRFVVLAVWGLTILYTWFSRVILRLIRRSLLRARKGHQMIAIIGQGKSANDIKSLYQARPVIGYTVVRQFKSWNEQARQDLEKLHRQRKLDVILLADPDITKDAAQDLIAFAANQNVTFRYLADLFAASFTNIEVSTAEGVPVIEAKRTTLDGWGRIAKRLFDVVCSLLFLTITSPIFLLTIIAIKLDSKGPIFFSRLDDGEPVERIGEGGRPFRYFKFRSMFDRVHSMRYTTLAHQDTRKGPLVKIKDDPRITRVGRFIRKWSIDEFPEFVLVLLGRMSLVGPRPHYPEEVANYKPYQRRVLAIKPGITGLAQISGRSDLDFDEEVKLDIWYMENWSLALDMYILLKTPLAVLQGRGDT